MVKTLNLTFDTGEYKLLVRARDLTDAESWEKFFLQLSRDLMENENNE